MPPTPLPYPQVSGSIVAIFEWCVKLIPLSEIFFFPNVVQSKTIEVDDQKLHNQKEGGGI